MLKKEVIKVVESTNKEVVSGYSDRPKKVAIENCPKWQPIVSLKFTNSFVVYKKFRMVTARTS